MNGKITEYNPYTKRGKISGSDGEHEFDASSELAGDLSNTIIPPDDPVAVTYDVAATGEAINVVLAQSITLAASAEPMARGFAAKKVAKKSAPKKKAAKAPARTVKKKSAGKKVAAKKSRKQPKRSARSKSRS